MIGRKIVQIAAIPLSQTGEEYSLYGIQSIKTGVFALCDDSTVWVSWMNAESESWSPWAPLPKIWQTLGETLGETTKD